MSDDDLAEGICELLYAPQSEPVIVPIMDLIESHTAGLRAEVDRLRHEEKVRDGMLREAADVLRRPGGYVGWVKARTCALSAVLAALDTEEDTKPSALDSHPKWRRHPRY